MLEAIGAIAGSISAISLLVWTLVQLEGWIDTDR